MCKKILPPRITEGARYIREENLLLCSDVLMLYDDVNALQSAAECYGKISVMMLSERYMR